MSYKTELHCHSSDFSWCSNQPGAEKAEYYIEQGYTSVVLTNHFPCYYPAHKEYESFVKSFFEAADVMRNAAGDRLHVLTGMELTFHESGNDYLVYGMTEELLLQIPEIFEMGLRNFFPWADERGLLVIQAHPLRFGIATREPWYLHGIEVYNAAHHSFCNKAAELWVELYNKEYNEDGRRFICTSGSDHHGSHQTACGGIETNSPITTMDELISTLKSGDYKLLRG